MEFTKEEIEKLQGKNSFLIQKSIHEDVKIMSDSEAHYFLMSLFDYVIDGVIPSLDRQDQRIVKSTFNRFKVAYDKDSSKWLDSCKRKSNNKKEEWNNKKNDKNGNPLQHPVYKK